MTTFPVSAPHPYDAYEEWNDILIDAGLCLPNVPAWDDVWDDTLEPAMPAPPTSRPFKPAVATPKAPVSAMPKAKCDKLTSDVIRLQNDLYAAHKRCARLDESKRRYEKESRELRDLSNELRTNLDDARRREADLQNDLARAREETANVKSQLTLAQKHYQDLARERGSVQILVEDLRSQLQERDVALSSCADKICEDEDRNAQLCALVAFFQKQAMRFRAELDARPENRPPPPMARPFPVVRLRIHPLTRPAGPSIPGNAWSPGEYMRQLKRQEYAQRVHMQKLNEQAEAVVKRLKGDLFTAVQQRNELKAETDKLYNELAACRRDTEAAKEVERLRDELMAAEAQRDELMNEITALQDEKIMLIQDSFGAEAAKIAAEEELEHLRGTLGEPADAVKRAEEARNTEATGSSPAVDVELTTLRESVDKAYSRLSAIITERLAARGVILQRAPRRDEMVVMISEFALHLAAGVPEASVPSAPLIEHTPSNRPAGHSTTPTMDLLDTEMAASTPEASVVGAPMVTTNGEQTLPAQLAQSSTLVALESPNPEMSTSQAQSSASETSPSAPPKVIGKASIGFKKVDRSKAVAQLKQLAGLLSPPPAPMAQSTPEVTPSEAELSPSPSGEQVRITAMVNC